ncbi:TlpA family protein disulfide reductase [Algibacillus agarilyticus]|uniref:TlpA family protein disulfide reductase n=1 Tax=Algibacillus agarilyticus TaxID=2234133 RepID=UPI000DD08A37|nr:TlpA disulfide reductase family protein [Algibacillus agarilyticus]
MKYLLLVIGFVFSLSANALSVGDMAPDFTLKNLEGKNQRLAEQKGQIIVLNFWASWCGPCRKEMPILETLHNKYTDLGVAVWAVNVEQESEAGRKFIADIGVNLPIFFDETNTISANYDVKAMPTTVVIDRDGKVRYVFKGYKSGYEKKYAKAIKKLIRE